MALKLEWWKKVEENWKKSVKDVLCKKFEGKVIDQAMRTVMAQDVYAYLEILKTLDLFTFEPVTLPGNLDEHTFAPHVFKSVGYFIRSDESVVETAAKEVEKMPGVWETGHNPLFGAYRERRVEVKNERCFKCGGEITHGLARERERGGAIMLLHVSCPTAVVRSKKK